MATSNTFDPLGTGLSCPFRLTTRQDFATASWVDLVRSDLANLLGIEPGEIPWRPSLGTSVSRLRHRGNSQALGELARIQIARNVAKWEPRVTILEVTTEGGTRGMENVRKLHIDYQIGANSKGRETITI